MSEKIKELLSETHWMVHDLVDADKITDEDEVRLIELRDAAAAEWEALNETIRYCMSLLDVGDNNRPLEARVRTIVEECDRLRRELREHAA